MRRTVGRLFHHQRDTPILRPMPVPAVDFAARVGYLLTRMPVVKHDPHPLEHEFANLLDREQTRYARSEPATQFLSRADMSMDALGRTDPRLLEEDFFGSELYTDAVKSTLQRYEVPKRAREADLIDLFDPATEDAPPQRHTLQRHLSDFLILIVRNKVTGKWTVPSVLRRERESMKQTMSRALAEHHGVLFGTYTFSNAPQAVVQPKDCPGLEEPLYIFNTMYLSGRPTFDNVTPTADEHAWVRRCELDEYEFVHEPLVQVLRDVAPSGVYDGSGAA